MYSSCLEVFSSAEREDTDQRPPVWEQLWVPPWKWGIVLFLLHSDTALAAVPHRGLAMEVPLHDS